MTTDSKTAAFVVALLTTATLVAEPAAAAVEARIDIAQQRMRVYVDGQEAYDWAVSTGRDGYETPRGSFRTERMYARYFSRKYDNAPMPYAVFFVGGVAVHGTTELRKLGRRASHGCVRLHPDNARAFFGLVRHHGIDNARVVVSD
jgi:lipoprotein-anchoring transpeptidase ErfK/SrfK